MRPNYSLHTEIDILTRILNWLNWIKGILTVIVAQALFWSTYFRFSHLHFSFSSSTLKCTASFPSSGRSLHAARRYAGTVRFAGSGNGSGSDRKTGQTDRGLPSKSGRRSSEQNATATTTAKAFHFCAYGGSNLLSIYLDHEMIRPLLLVSTSDPRCIALKVKKKLSIYLFSGESSDDLLLEQHNLLAIELFGIIIS